MDITVIGHVCKDSIILPGETSPATVQFGGIVYSIATLAGLSQGKDAIHPVFGVGEKDYEELIEFLKSLPGVDTDGVFPVRGRTNEVTLVYGTPDVPRVECSEHISEPIPFPRIKPFLKAHGVAINMISGSDISLETLDAIRMHVRDERIPIHFDFHSLTLGIQKKGKRFRRPLTDWRRWCFMLHTIQMSDDEALGLSAERYDEQTLVNQLMPLMVNVLLLTRGAKGVTVIEQDAHKRLTRTEIPGISVGTRDTTGCGDVFGAAYLLSLLQKLPPVAAATKANEIAALHASLESKGKPLTLARTLLGQVAIAGTASL